MRESQWGKGQRGEDLAARYMQQKGYEILARNYRAMGCEIDSIAIDGDTLVFAEVKARGSEAFGLGREAVGREKQARIIRGAQAYLQERGWVDKPCRFDVLEVDLRTGKVEQIEAAFTQ